MNKWAFIYFLLCWSLPATLLCGKDVPMLHYGIEDGLPSNNVYSIYRDKKGFLWFATDKGVGRYNGLKFEVFTAINGLPDNEVFNFKEDEYGRLWMATYNGELCYYQDQVFHTAVNTPFLKLPFKAPHIYNITLEQDSSVTFNFYDYLLLVNIKKDRLVTRDFNKIQGLRPPRLQYIYYKKQVSPDLYQLIYENEVLYVDSSYRLVRKQERKLWVPLKYIPSQDQGYFTSDDTYIPIHDSDTLGNDIILSQDLDPVISLRKPIYNKKTIHSFFQDIDRVVFIGTDKGLIVNDSTSILEGNNISSVTKDNAGNYWVSTLNNGVYCLSAFLFRTSIIKNAYTGNVKFCKSLPRCVIFTNDDNRTYSLAGNKVSFLFDPAEYKKDDPFTTKNGASLVDSDNYYFFAKFGVFVHNMTNNSTRFCKYIHAKDSSGIKEVFLIPPKVYIIGRSAISSLDNNSLKHAGEVDWNLLVSDRTQRIFGMAPQNDQLWYSTVSNVYKLENDQPVVQPQFKGVTFKSFIFFNDALVGYTHNGQLLVCTDLNKNIRIDTITGQSCLWDKFFKLDATHILLTNNNLHRILTVNYNYNKSKVSVKVIESPFIPREVDAICADSNNCYFFKNGAVTRIAISDLLSEPRPPAIYFSTIRYGNTTTATTNKTKLSFAESRNVKLTFSPISFYGQNVSVQYSVSKNNSDRWTDIKGDEIDLIDPGYGTYTVKLRARTMATSYCEPLSFVLIIDRPFWASWWFISIIVISAVATVIIFARYRIAYILRRDAKKHEGEIKFMRSEYKALNALMNPHFVFNTLNNVQGLVNRNDKLAANEYIRVFADLVRQNMHNLSKDVITLQKEIDLVTNYLLLEKLRFKELLNYQVTVQDAIDLTEIMVPPLLVQPLVENSIKHGILPLGSLEGTIFINIYEQDDRVFIEVKDNGIGIARSKELSQRSLHESFGTDNIRKRIEQLSMIQGKTITFDIREQVSEEGKHEWTIVTISMPIS